VASDDFEFMVEESVDVTGRGVAVFGEWRSGQFQSGDAAFLHLSGSKVILVGRVDVEFARVDGGERPALLPRGLQAQNAPAGSVVRARP
jgi:hypothetical protein